MFRPPSRGRCNSPNDGSVVGAVAPRPPAHPERLLEVGGAFGADQDAKGWERRRAPASTTASLTDRERLLRPCAGVAMNRSATKRASFRRAIAVPAGPPTRRVGLAFGQAGEFGHLSFHHRLGNPAHSLAQEVGVASATSPCAPCPARPSCHRPSWCPPCRRLLVHRREDERGPPRLAAIRPLHQLWGLNRHAATLLGALELAGGGRGR